MTVFLVDLWSLSSLVSGNVMNGTLAIMGSRPALGFLYETFAACERIWDCLSSLCLWVSSLPATLTNSRRITQEDGTLALGD